MTTATGSSSGGGQDWGTHEPRITPPRAAAPRRALLQGIWCLSSSATTKSAGQRGQRVVNVEAHGEGLAREALGKVKQVGGGEAHHEGPATRRRVHESSMMPAVEAPQAAVSN